MFKRNILLCSLSLLSLCGFAQTYTPVIRQFDFGDQSMLSRMSNNGLWAVNNGSVTRIVSLETEAVTEISSKEVAEKAYDISDDGSIVVGSQEGSPAVYKKGAWTKLATKGDYVYGFANSITPDGKLAVGNLAKDNDGYQSIAALWDLSTGKLIETPGLPKKDMAHENKDMMDFRGGISADGQTILGCMSYSYLPTDSDLGGCFFFVYHRDSQSYDVIGFTESDTKRWNPMDQNLFFVGEATISNNGRYVTGGAYYTESIAEGQDFGNEYDVPYLYDTQTKEFVGYTETEAQSTASWSVSNSGVVALGSPIGSPVREWSIRHGEYWFTLPQILKQKYNIDFYKQTGYTNTGTVYSISDDGTRLLCFPDPYSSYTITFPEPIEKLSEGLKLLGAFDVYPAEGSEVSHLKSATLTFDRNVKVLAEKSAAQILDADGDALFASTALTAEGKTVSVKFRKGTMEAGQQYRLYIPAGAIAMEHDESQTTEAIYVTFNGRADEPVRMVEVIPADNATFAKIDYSTNPVMMEFNTNVILTDTVSAQLYRNDEEAPFCSLIAAYLDNKVALYPSTTQYLFDGSTYRVVLNEGSVTDVAGNNPNETITLHYNGNYERVISADDVSLFSDNFNSGYGNFMMWCGDQLAPTTEMEGWDFSKGMAWGLVLDDDATDDRSAASHSMFSPPGESDDWLVIPQIYIPDMLCSLKFQSQSYLKAKEDILKVVVWKSDNVYNTLNKDIIDCMKDEGVVIYEKRQSPGKEENLLADDWTDNRVSLADFAGKNVYIAFVNQNNDQSAIFLDNVEVRHEMDFLVSFNYENRVVNRESAAIKGTITNNSDEKTYSMFSTVLKDADGNIVDSWTSYLPDGLKKGDKVTFEFANPLPLTFGITNKFTVIVACDNEQNVVNGSIDNLAFEPVKRVVLEEYTGRDCGNCPLGIIAIERLEARYGDHFLPISIHTYPGDNLGNGLSSYTSSLGLDSYGAPSGTVNRHTPCYPGASATVDGETRFYFCQDESPEVTDPLWEDIVKQEMETPATGDIALELTYDELDREITAHCDVCYALNASNLNVNLLAVLLEDNLTNYQKNYFSSTAAAELGDWGNGGKYGQSTVARYQHQDVCRNAIGLTINGTSGYVPSNVTAGEHYKASIAIPASNLEVPGNGKVIVMMIDNNTGLVINAARAYVDAPDAVASTRIQSGESVIYDLQGRRLRQLQPGVNIINGKKIVK